MSISLYFKPLSLEDISIIESWTYQGFMTSVDMSFYHQNLKEKGLLKGPLLCDGFSVFYGKERFGLLEVYKIKEGIEIGLALKPTYVGKGLSKAFIYNSVCFIKAYYTYSEDYIYLSVDKKHQDAYHAYLKAGFKVYKERASDVQMRLDVSLVID